MSWSLSWCVFYAVSVAVCFCMHKFMRVFFFFFLHVGACVMECAFVYSILCGYIKQSSPRFLLPGEVQAVGSPGRPGPK